MSGIRHILTDWQPQSATLAAHSTMLFKALSAAVYGIDANLIDVEVDYSGVVSEQESSTPWACPMRRCARAATACAPPSRTPAT